MRNLKRMAAFLTALSVSQATAILLLREMTQDGLLEKWGTVKNLRYYLVET